MIDVNPITRITCQQIRNHSWFTQNSIRMVNYLNVDNEIDPIILEKCLSYPQFSNISKIYAIQDIKSNTQNELVTAYKILADSERKKKSCNNKYLPSFTQLNSKSSNSKKNNKTNNKKNLKYSHNWTYGFRCNIKARTLMERLFAALKDIDLEWRILDNFSIRIRPVNISKVSNGVRNENILRFDIKVYKVSNI